VDVEAEVAGGGVCVEEGDQGGGLDVGFLAALAVVVGLVGPVVESGDVDDLSILEPVYGPVAVECLPGVGWGLLAGVGVAPEMGAAGG